MVGRGHEPDINPDRLRAAQALEFLFLQYTQQLRLQLERDITDFVKEQRALVGQFKPADLGGDGAGERASLVTEQLALQQAGGNGCAVHFDERPLSAPAQVVDRACNEFFARAGLSLNQNSGIGRRDFVHFRQHAP